MSSEPGTQSRQNHWDAIYRLKGERPASWFEAVPALSLELMDAAGLTPASCVLDVGAGESRLVEAMLNRGVRCVTVLDISVEALTRARARLGERAGLVTWIQSDVFGDWSIPPIDIWHDRALFHFLRTRDERERYVQRMTSLLRPHGSVVIATFAENGPQFCSGLPVVRYSPHALAAELGDDFVLVESRRHVHATPSGVKQSFQYSRFRFLG